MNLKRIRLLIWKEFLQLRRDPLLLRLLFLLPVLQLVMMGYVVGADVKNLSTAVVDLDRTVTSRRLADSFASSGYFRITQRPAKESDLKPLLDRGDVKVALVIPEGTEAGVSAGRATAGGHRGRRLRQPDRERGKRLRLPAHLGVQRQAPRRAGAGHRRSRARRAGTSRVQPEPAGGQLDDSRS